MGYFRLAICLLTISVGAMAQSIGSGLTCFDGCLILPPSCGNWNYSWNCQAVVPGSSCGIYCGSVSPPCYPNIADKTAMAIKILKELGFSNMTVPGFLTLVEKIAGML